MKDPLALYTVRKFLELVPISRATFWRYVAKGDIEVVRVYGRTLIPASVLAHILDHSGRRDLERRRETASDNHRKDPS